MKYSRKAEKSNKTVLKAELIKGGGIDREAMGSNVDVLMKALEAEKL